MRNLEEYTEKCKEMLDVLDIQYGNVLEVIPNYRAKSRWGQCKPVPGGFLININAELLDERNDEIGLINTIVHELLHTCDGCMNHGGKWKILAFKFYQEYGIEIKPTSTASEKGLCADAISKTATRKEAEAKYVVKCTRCGNTILRYRASKLTEHIDRYRCGYCHGPLTLC